MLIFVPRKENGKERTKTKQIQYLNLFEFDKCTALKEPESRTTKQGQ